MLLNGKNALVFAATGAIASETARTFAREGAHVWISGRDAARLAALADQIKADGGQADWEVVDAADQVSVDGYVNRLAGKTQLDVVFNGIGARPATLSYPAPVEKLDMENFMKPFTLILGSQYLTARAAGLQMVKQGKGGAIVTLSATLSGMAAAFMSNLSATCSAIEGLTRALAGEFGPAGIRVNCVRGSAMPETTTIQETFAGQTELLGQPPQLSLPPLRRPITVAETAATAAYLASEYASGMTGQIVTVCAGAFVG